MGDAPIRVLCRCEDASLADRVVASLGRAEGWFTVTVEPSASEGCQRLRNEDFDCVVAVLSGSGTADEEVGNGLATGERGVDRLADADSSLPVVLVGSEPSGDELAGHDFEAVKAVVDTGQLDGLASRVRDVVSGPRADGGLETLRASDEQLRAVVEASPNAIVALDTDERVRLWNPAAEELFGWSESEVLGEPNPIVPADRREEFDDLYGGALEGEEFSGVEVHRKTKDGEKRCLSLSTARLQDEAGDVTGAVAVFEDVTERKRRERELEESRRKYRSLVEAAPDPIFIADAETGEIVEVNQQAERMTGRSRDELVGMHQTELHPREDREDHAEGFKHHQQELGSVDEDGSTIRQFADGKDLLVVTDDGETVPVEITASLLEIDGRTYQLGIFRDVSHHKEYERTLKALNEATRRFHQAESRTEVCEIVVDIATDVLDQSIVGVHLFDKENSTLPPVAYSLESEDFGEPPTVQPGGKAVWDVFATNERAVFDDVREESGAFEPDTPIRSAVLAPVEGVGVLVVGDDEVGQCDDRLVELVEILAGTTGEAIHRVTREQHLREREERLERQTSRLERLDDVNRQIRRVLEAAVRANTREEIETEVCERLVETERFAFAWIASVDSTHDRLVPEAWAGNERGYLDVLDMSVGDRAAGPPEVRTAVTRETTVVEYVTDRIQDERWRQETFAREFKSAIAIPLGLGDVMHGVLTIYADRPDAFDDLSRDVLVELGQTVAYAIGSVEQRRSLLMDRAVELELEITDDDCLWKQFAERAGCTFEILSTIPHDEDTTIAFVELVDGDFDRFLATLEEHPSVIEADAVGDGTDGADGNTVRVLLGESSVAGTLVEVGGQVTHREVSDAGMCLRVRAPPDVDVRSVVSLVESQYPDVRLASRQETSVQSSREWDDSVFAGLTQRQREVLKVAYYNGYFAWPRDASIEELADVFDVASSTFSRHLRVAQGKLFGNVFDESDLR